MSFENPVVGGEGGELIRESIKSPDFVPGVSGWIIRRDGSAEFNNVNIRLDLTTGSITVGPDTGVQVVIRSTGTEGLIEFPTNVPQEVDVAYAQGTFFGIGDLRSIALQLSSGSTNGGAATGLILRSGSDDGTLPPSVTVGGNLTRLRIIEEESFEFEFSPVLMHEELAVSTNNPDTNFPVRVVSGRVDAGTTDTALSKVADTAITNSGAASTYLEAGVAYEVEVQISIRSTVGTSAAGTQRVQWKLWDGAVGGTQLGPTVVKFTNGVGSLMNSMNFTFLFEHTGSTASRTLNLSGIHTNGTDTVSAQVNPQYFILAKRVGDPAKITNL